MCCLAVYVPGDLAAFACVSRTGTRMVVASFHGDTNGLATIPMIKAVQDYATKMVCTDCTPSLYYSVCTVCTTASVLSLLLRLHCLYYYSSDDGVAWPPWSSMRMLPMRMLPHMSQALHTHAHTNTHAHTHTQRERERETTTHTHTLTHSHTHTLTHSLTHARAHTHTVPGPHADRGSGRQHVQASRSRPKPPKCARLPVLPRIPLPLQLLGSPSRHWCVLCVRACVCACV